MDSRGEAHARPAWENQGRLPRGDGSAKLQGATGMDDVERGSPRTSLEAQKRERDSKLTLC